AAAVGCCLLAPSAGSAATIDYKVKTVPPVAGAVFKTKNRTYRTDRRGNVVLRLARGAAMRDEVRVVDKTVRPGVRAHFARWYGGKTVTFNLLYRMSFSFRDLADKPVAPSLVSAVFLKSRTGVRTAVPHGRPTWLQGSRVVPFKAVLVSKHIDYQVERTTVDGANVVNRAQQRFTPAHTHKLDVKLLFYGLKVRSRDALLGFPVGSAVEVRYPSGRLVSHSLDGGRTHIGALPRGNYKVKVAASGISFERPVAVSRNQEVELKVISWLDLALAALALGGVTVGLLVARRPHLLRFLRRRRALTAK
ncbi:MAG: hypothetical protein QOE08_1375, partial [Thermoleophilaceae bacterium]|nr:hypothetical protein [Thermoleophilaceae bacterium]